MRPPTTPVPMLVLDGVYCAVPDAAVIRRRFSIGGRMRPAPSR